MMDKKISSIRLTSANAIATVTEMDGTNPPEMSEPRMARTTSTLYIKVDTNVPSSTCVMRSRIKLRSTREPYCCEAIDSATDASENVTLAAVIMDPAMVLSNERAPSGPPD